jgi:histidyl-tRNA synthetase
MMAADTMEALGIPRGSYVVKVNNRKVLEGLREAIGVPYPIDDRQWITVLRAIDKLDRLGANGVFELLTTGRTDASGDRTVGAQLTTSSPDSMSMGQADNVMRFLGYASNVKGYVKEWEALDISASAPNEERLDWFRSKVNLGETGLDGVMELEQIARLAKASGYKEDRILIDRSVVRGLEYYTGPVYEVELLLETNDEKGRPVRFGSVGGGGRYDGLVSRFRGEPVPATGFSIGVSRLQAALTMLGKIDTTPVFGPVVVTVFDRDRVADYQKMVAQLRNANIRAELYLGNPKNMGNQLKYADRRHSPCVIIQGSDEKSRGEVQIKDLIEGVKAAAAIASNQEWRETRPAQFSCREDELVAKVREVLARHEVKWN